MKSECQIHSLCVGISVQYPRSADLQHSSGRRRHRDGKGDRNVREERVPVSNKIFQCNTCSRYEDVNVVAGVLPGEIIAEQGTLILTGEFVRLQILGIV